MKRANQAITILCAGVMAVSLAACAGSDSKVNEAYASSVEASASAALESAMSSALSSAMSSFASSLEKNTTTVSSSKTSNTTAETTIATTTTTTTTTTFTPAPPIEANIGDTVTIGNWEITFNSYAVMKNIAASNGLGQYSADDGNLYVVVHLSVKNVGKSVDTFDPLSISDEDEIYTQIIYQDEYEFNGSHLLGEEKNLCDCQINPLSTKTGYLAFNMAEEAANSDDLVLHIGLVGNLIGATNEYGDVYVALI